MSDGTVTQGPSFIFRRSEHSYIETDRIPFVMLSRNEDDCTQTKTWWRGCEPFAIVFTFIIAVVALIFPGIGYSRSTSLLFCDIKEWSTLNTTVTVTIAPTFPAIQTSEVIIHNGTVQRS